MATAVDRAKPKKRPQISNIVDEAKFNLDKFENTFPDTSPQQVYIPTELNFFVSDVTIALCFAGGFMCLGMALATVMR